MTAGYWTINKPQASCPFPGGEHSKADVKAAHWELGLKRAVQLTQWWAEKKREPPIKLDSKDIRRALTKVMGTHNSSLRSHYADGAKAPSNLAELVASSNAWLRSTYKAHCDQHGTTSNVIPPQWLKGAGTQSQVFTWLSFCVQLGCMGDVANCANKGAHMA